MLLLFGGLFLASLVTLFNNRVSVDSEGIRILLPKVQGRTQGFKRLGARCLSTVPLSSEYSDRLTLSMVDRAGSEAFLQLELVSKLERVRIFTDPLLLGKAVPRLL
jgi:hypothetical protein